MRLDARRKTLCTICTTDEQRPVLIDEQEWKIHTNSRTHKRMIQRIARREKWQQYLRDKEDSMSEAEGEPVS